MFENAKLKKQIKKLMMEEIKRLSEEISILDPTSKEYEELSTRRNEAFGILNDESSNDVKAKNVWVDNVCGFLGIALGTFLPTVFGLIPSPQSWNFLKNKLKH